MRFIFSLVLVFMTGLVFAQEYFGFPTDIPIEVYNNCDFNQSCANVNANTTKKFHTGIDFVRDNGATTEIPILAASSGMVISLPSETNGNHCLGNNVVILEHIKTNGERVYSLYGHLDETLVVEGQVVKKGEIIGRMGDLACDGNGSSTTNPPHVHFEVKESPVIHNPIDGGGCNGDDCWGYVPSNAENFGYINPATYFDIETVFPHPDLVSPVGGATVNSAVTISWDDIFGADAYRLHLSTSPDGWTANGGFYGPMSTEGNYLINNGDSELSLVLEEGVTYYWTVRAGNQVTGSFYSPVNTFTTNGPACGNGNIIIGENSSSIQLASLGVNFSSENGFDEFIETSVPENTLEYKVSQKYYDKLYTVKEANGEFSEPVVVQNDINIFSANCFNLYLANLVSNSNATEGQSNSVSFTQGVFPASTNEFTTTTYVYWNTVPEPGGIFLGERSTTLGDGDEDDNHIFNFQTPNGTGIRYIVLHIDPNDDFPEIDEGNNIIFKEIQVFSSPVNCGQVQNLGVSNITTNSAFVYWNNILDADSYQVEFNEVGSIATLVSTNNSNYQFSNLSANTSYNFKVRPICDGSIGPWVLSSFTTDGTVGGSCLPVEDLNLEITGLTSVSIDWADNPNANDYRFEMINLDEGDGVLGTTSNSSRNYSGLVPGTNYRFIVRSQCDNGFSIYREILFTTPDCLEPDNVTVSNVSYSTAYASWSQVPYADSYEYEYGPVGGPYVNGTTQNNFLEIEFGLEADEEHDFSIRVNCQNLTTGYTGTVFYTTEAPLPVEILSFTGTTDFKKNILKLQVAIEQNVSKYILERSTDGLQFNEAMVINASASHYYVFEDEDVDAKTYYKIRIVDFDGSFELTEVLMLNNNLHSTFLVYPNPVTDMLNIKSSTNGQVILYDVNGRIQIATNIFSDSNVINVSDLSTGIYIVKFIGNGLSKNFKLIKK